MTAACTGVLSVVRRGVVPVALAAVLGLGIAGTGALPWATVEGSGVPLAALLVPAARAASPGTSPGLGGDTRSPGVGPGFVGAPVLAILGVVGLGLATALLTLLYVRLTGRSSGQREPTGRSTRDGPASNGPDSNGG